MSSQYSIALAQCCLSTTSSLWGLPPRKTSSFLWSVKDNLGLKKVGVYSIPCECGQVYTGQMCRSTDTRLKEHQRRIRLEHADKPPDVEHSTNLVSRIELNHTAILSTEPDTWVTSSGRRLRLSSIPTVRTGRMPSVWASHGNLSTAPQMIVRSLHHMTADLGSLWGHAGPCILPSSRHKICPLWAVTSLCSDVLGSFRYPCSLIPPSPHMPVTLSLTYWFPSQHTLTLPPVFFLDLQNCPFSKPS
jgi:hypothetical protein